MNALPVELADLRTVKEFAQLALNKLGNAKLDYLFLNAAVSKAAEGMQGMERGPNGSKWSEAYLVNHLCEYLSV